MVYLRWEWKADSTNALYMIIYGYLLAEVWQAPTSRYDLTFVLGPCGSGKRTTLMRYIMRYI
jgi:ABC-type cobalamin/Fe3+-siderophores transport system ATPase subunit